MLEGSCTWSTVKTTTDGNCKRNEATTIWSIPPQQNNNRGNCSTEFVSDRYNTLQSFNELPNRRVPSEFLEMRLSCQRMNCSNSKANKHANDHYAEYTCIYNQPREV